MVSERKGVDPVKVREHFGKMLATSRNLRAAIQPDAELLNRHRIFSNVVYYSLFSERGDIPVNPTMAYRFVDYPALLDLATVGFVRNSQAAQRGPEQAYERRVFWTAHEKNSPYENSGLDDSQRWIDLSSAAYIEVPLTKLNKLVTIADIEGIYIKDVDSGRVINLLAEETVQ